MTKKGMGLFYSYRHRLTSSDKLYIIPWLHYEKYLDTYQESPNNFEGNNSPQKSYLVLNLGYQRNLSIENLTGSLQPIIFIEMGTNGEIQYSNRNLNIKSWRYRFAIGPGIEFIHLGVLERFSIGYSYDPQIRGNIVVDLSIFWK